MSGKRGTQENPTRCGCKICNQSGWSHLPWWVHTPFEVYRVLTGGRIYKFRREEFKKFLAAGATGLTYLAPEGRTRMLDQLQGGYFDWETYWTLDLISPSDLNRLDSSIIRNLSLKEMKEEEEFGINYNFDDEADGAFPIEIRKNGRLLTKDGIWIK